MSYKITIASGKGGTGKTTFAVSLYRKLVKKLNEKVYLIDCDVEEPNDVIFFPEAEEKCNKAIFQQIPKIDTAQCTFCSKCVEFCEFNAISVLSSVKFAEVNPSLCHSCGACLIACKQSAIQEFAHSVGTVSTYHTSDGEELMEGKLKIGSSMQTMLIKELKKKVPKDAAVSIYDAPPGTSCSVVETTINSDYVVLVTEPTPFGLHDLKLTVELMEDLKKDFGVVINKAGLGNMDAYVFIKENSLELLGEIPFANSFASQYAQGNLTRHIPQEIEEALNNIVDKLTDKILVHEGNNCC